MNHTLHRENSCLVAEIMSGKGKDDIHLLRTFDFRGLRTSFLMIKPNKTK